MTRIEWTRLSGEEVETVVSMLIYSGHPHATRIRPSRGDLGIDVLDSHPGDPSLKDVYQIKKFATNLSSSQKGQIEDSFQQVLIGMVRRHVPLADWRLVMPLDPTPENFLDWFREFPDKVISQMSSNKALGLTKEEIDAISAWRLSSGANIEWKGLTYCDTLAGRYPSVDDYYLHGGRERINDATAEVVKILQRDISLRDPDSRSTSILEPHEIEQHLSRLARALDGDPHFRYGFSVDPTVPQLRDEPGVIAMTQRRAPDGTCVTFRIFERFAEALNMRPIPIELQLQCKVGSAEHQEVVEWLKYGRPLTVTGAINADLPGGLGGTFDRVTAHIIPIDEGGEYKNRYRIVSPDGKYLAELLFCLSATKGIDGTGVAYEGNDASGIVSVGVKYDMTKGHGKATFSFEDFTGHPAAEVTAATDFLANLSSPNRLQVSGEYGPFQDFQNEFKSEAPVPLTVARYINALAVFQAHTSTVIKVPDLTHVKMDDVRTALLTVEILNGRILTGTWKTMEWYSDNAAEIDPEEQHQVQIIEPLVATIGAETLTLGAARTTLMSATLTKLDEGRVRAEPRLNDAAQYAFAPDEPVPDRSMKPVRFRALPEM